nr:uncharacterized protein KIAA0754 homolog [Camelus dromedarius]
MGKPLSRPDCLRQNPTCLGKGEEEDGYIEDCYVPQRSIYDTMRINEQIDQGSKLNQTSKSTMEKMEGSTISSNGTLGAASNVFESRAPEGKKLDERIIFDALKLSSDVQKSAPVPPRRRPNAERKDNVNRRSWKSFMPPNFPEFAERMEASLSEVSEAGASNPSLQEKKESSSALTESSGHLDHREPQTESVTLEHMSRSIGIPEVQDVKNLGGDCQDFRFQQHSESSPREFQPLESEAVAASGNTDVMQEHRFSSATWPRAMKSLTKGGFSEKQHPLGDTACTVEMPPLSPCLSEELLDPELHILITPSLREKTESELKFEEDERWIMMEAEEEWEEEKLSERGKTFLMADEEKNSLADIFREREPASPVAVVEDEADSSAAVLGAFDHLALGQICCSDEPQSSTNCLASVLKGAPLDYSRILTGENAVGELRNRTGQGLEGLGLDLECTVGPANSEQLSDTDSVQMFLELEKECLYEEGVTLVELENQTSSEGLAPSQDAENSLVIIHFPGAALEKERVGLLNVEAKDSDPGLDGEYFHALNSSQVPNAVELAAYSDTVKDASTVCEKEGEKVPFSPQTAGEFKFRDPADLESLGKPDPGGLANSDHRASHEENILGFKAELAKENGSLSQVDCSEVEGDAEECVERAPLSSAISNELTGVTSGSEVDVLYDSHLLTDKIHLEGRKKAINQDNNSLTSLGDVDPCELLSMEGVCDEDGEARALGYEARLEAPASAHLHQGLPESEVLSLHLLVGGLGHSRDGVEAVNNAKPKWNVASSEGGETEMKDSDPLLDIFLEEQVTKASTSEPVLEEWVPIPQKPAPAAAVPTVEDDALDAAVPAPEGTAVAAITVPFPEEDVPVVSGATIGAHVSAVSVVTVEDAPAAAVSATERAAAPAVAVPAPEGTAPAAAVAVTGEDMLAVAESFPEGIAPAAAVAVTEDDVPERPVTPAVAVPAPGEPDTPTVRVLIPEGPAAPATALPTLGEPVTPATALPIPGETAAPAAAVPTLGELATLATALPAAGEPAAPASALPTLGELDTPAAALPTPGKTAAPAAAIPTLGEPATPATALPIPGETAAPAAAMPILGEPAALATALPTPGEPAAPASVVPTPGEPAALASVLPTPGEPAAPAAAVPTPGEPAALASVVPTPGEPAAPASVVPTPGQHAAPAAAGPIPGEPAAPASAVPTPGEPAAPAAAVPTPGEPAAPASVVPTPGQHAAPAAAGPIPGEPAAPANRGAHPRGPAAPVWVPTPGEPAAQQCGGLHPGQHAAPAAAGPIQGACSPAPATCQQDLEKAARPSRRLAKALQPTGRYLRDFTRAR